MKNKNLLKEVRQFKKIAGLLKEDDMEDGIVTINAHNFDNVEDLIGANVADVNIDQWKEENPDYNIETPDGRIDVGGDYIDNFLIYDQGDGFWILKDDYEGTETLHSRADLVKILRALGYKNTNELPDYSSF